MLPAATRLLLGADALDELVELQPVGGQLHRIDDDLDQVLARALQHRLQHARHLLDAVAQLARRRRQRPLGHVAGKRHDQHREFGEVDLVDGRLLGGLRQVALGILRPWRVRPPGPWTGRRRH